MYIEITPTDYRVQFRYQSSPDYDSEIIDFAKLKQDLVVTYNGTTADKTFADIAFAVAHGVAVILNDTSRHIYARLYAYGASDYTFDAMNDNQHAMWKVTNGNVWTYSTEQPTAGVLSFNGRTGAVMPQTGDYDIPTKTSDLTNDSGFLTEHQSLAEYRKASAQNVIDAGKQAIIADLDTIRSGAAAGATAVQPEAGKGLFSGNYDDLSNKPTIPSKTSDLTNDSGFITKSVSDLVNYYLKSETYTKSEVQSLIAAIKQFSYEVVAVLPTASASTMHKIYLVPSASQTAQNVKDEYITIDNGSGAATRYTWEQIGSTSIDLSNYVTITQLNTALANYTTTAALTTLLAGKQDTISDLAAIRSGAALGATALQSVPNTYRTAAAQDVIDAAKYTKPTSGIPESDLASGVTTKLNAAKVTDVQMGGQSIVTNEVATIPTATTISAQSTDSQIPTAKAVFDIVGDIESLLAAL